MFDVFPRVEDIDDFIDLVGISAGKRNDFVVLRHLSQKVLCMRPEDVAFGFSSAMTEYLDYVDD